MASLKIALLCSGLGNIHRGHEVFASSLFEMLQSDLDITLFKGGGEPSTKECVIPNIARDDPTLNHIKLAVSRKWEASMVEQEKLRIEAETFSYAALRPLLDGDFDIIHCLEREVCERLFALRHLFKRVPKFVFSNGGAIPARNLPPCDFVQEHTPYNRDRSRRDQVFMIPHGVDVERFRPGIKTSFRHQHAIPSDVLLVLSVGTVCYWHKRMDHVIREVAAVPDAWLAIIGQEGPDTPEIKRLGEALMPGRIVFTKMPHGQLHEAYAAADVFVLGSLFETFGIVYIEAMAAGVPVIATEHPNQRGIIKEGIFIDMNATGALSAVIRNTPREKLRELGRRGREVAQRDYDLRVLKKAYIDQYQAIAAVEVTLPTYNMKARALANLKQFLRLMARPAH